MAFDKGDNSFVSSRRHTLKWLGSLSLLTQDLFAQEANSYPLRVLLISNQQYRHSPPLLTPHNDTGLLAKVFKARGAAVTVAKDLTADRINSTLAAWLEERSPRDCLWVGFSGHAVQLGGQNYLQGIDASFSSPGAVRKNGVALSGLLNLIDARKPAAAVFSLDACRNDPFEPRRTRGVTGLAAEDPQGICISFSTAPYMEALDGDDRENSPYARALASVLAADGRKSLDSVLRDTSNIVYTVTNKQQVPEHRSALRSEWWFDRSSITLVPPSAPIPVAVKNPRAKEASYRADAPPAMLQPPAGGWQAETESFRSTPDFDLFVRAPSRLSDREKLEASYALASSSFRHGKADVTSLVISVLGPLARKGHAVAQYLIGDAYFNQGDFKEAYLWLSLAARAGYAPLLDKPVDPTAGVARMMESTPSSGYLIALENFNLKMKMLGLPQESNTEIFKKLLGGSGS